MKNNIFEEKAVTLIALVVTIILMLIIAGIISVNVISKGGLIDIKDRASNDFNKRVNTTNQSIENIQNDWKGVLDKKGIENAYGDR